jgi:hypothetical protein
MTWEVLPVRAVTADNWTGMTIAFAFSMTLPSAPAHRVKWVGCPGTEFPEESFPLLIY